MKRGKEIKIESIEHLNVVFGTVDNKNPKSVYINISGWADPLIDDIIDYDRVIRNIHKQIKQLLHNSLSDNLFHRDKTIVDFDMRESGIIYGKRSYMSCEINLYQSNNFDLDSDELFSGLIQILTLIVTDNLHENEYFKFHKTKV